MTFNIGTRTLQPAADPFEDVAQRPASWLMFRGKNECSLAGTSLTADSWAPVTDAHTAAMMDEALVGTPGIHQGVCENEKIGDSMIPTQFASHSLHIRIVAPRARDWSREGVGQQFPQEIGESLLLRLCSAIMAPLDDDLGAQRLGAKVACRAVPMPIRAGWAIPKDAPNLAADLAKLGAVQPAFASIHLSNMDSSVENWWTVGAQNFPDAGTQNQCAHCGVKFMAISSDKVFKQFR